MKHKFTIDRKVVTWLSELYEVDSDKSFQDVVDQALDYEINPTYTELDYDYIDYLDDYEIKDSNHKLVDCNVSDDVYHVFWVSDYKGGHIHQKVNLSLRDIIDLLLDYMSEDEYDYVVANLGKVPNDKIKDIFNKVVNEGDNTYAFDYRSKFSFYKSTVNGPLVKCNPVDEYRFITELKALIKEYEAN